ncbi:NlpC/P60 family protein [Streptomyces sp. DSM 44917]|uniref:NlpC/P60 family protein n=1 Tax=Streptomyces boetiae TaxID=3075541 RepID=A0ABU2LAC5_9ACTN|nr:NlpC/P60 family protein [Streptomyces sp. DSM 44917]MDT0308514.1 NlpC/P60 family protein [Streptomyces sp. DSM 44917]
MAEQRTRRPWRAARRKPVPAALRAAATLTLAGAASAATLGGAALADPAAGPPAAPAEVEARVDTLHRQAEEAAEAYHAANEAAAEADATLERLTDRSERRAAELNDARAALGAHARAEYRAGTLPGSLRLALSADPDDFLGRAGLLDRLGERQAHAVREVGSRLRDLERLRAEARVQADRLTESRERARRQRELAQDRLAEAEALLASRTAEERRRLLADGRGNAGGAPVAELPDRAAPTERAAAAVAFALAQQGKPYVWGATGPDAFDCSGLTQAAWRAAGVSLPRTSYAQAGAGRRVSRGELAPGDLVFYYSGVSHVGLYVGDGRIVHASRPGTPVRLAPVDSMPFAGAARPA